MNLSNVSNIRFNGSDVKLAKIDGVIIHRKEEESPLLKARYTANASGVVPRFNSGYVYEVNEVESNGIYTVEITSEDDFSNCNFNGKSNLLTVEYLKVTNKVTSMSQMFRNCKALTSLDVTNWDTGNIVDMYQAFFHCDTLTSLDLSNFNPGNIYSMESTFEQCTTLTSLDLSNFDVSKVSDMSLTFRNCHSLTSLKSMMNIKGSLTLPSTLNEESVLDVVDNLATVTSTKTLKISTTQLSWISEDKIKEANDKGWTISA